MNRRSALLFFARLSALPAVVALSVCGETPTAGERLTLEEVVNMTRAGFSEEIIVTRIKKNGKAFDLSTDELRDLKMDGVSDNVIKFLLDPSQPYIPPTPPTPGAPQASSKPSGPIKKYPEDRYANRLPADPGLYLFVAGAPVKVDLKVLLGAEQAKTLMKKGKTVGYLVGPDAKIRLKNSAPIFYVRLPDGKEIEELVLVSLSTKNGRREIALGAPGPKQQLNAGDIQPYDPLEVATRVFRLTPAKLDAGEYLFLFMGSADPAKGIYGKGYDFGIDPPGSPKK